jgi:hypothetical protein
MEAIGFSGRTLRGDSLAQFGRKTLLAALRTSTM